MSEQTFNTRIILKHDIEAHWNLATGFIPRKGEIVIYDADESHAYPRFKIGDGVQQADGTIAGTKVNDLPFLHTLRPEIEDVEFITTEDIDTICGAMIQVATLSEVTF